MLVLLLGCRPAADPVEPPPPPKPVRVDDAVRPEKEELPVKVEPTVTLEHAKPVDLDSGTRIILHDMVFEQIEASPDDPEAYPAGSGVTLTVEVEGKRLELSKLSEGYDSKLSAWSWTHKVTLVEIDPGGKPGASFRVEKVGESPVGEALKLKLVKRTPVELIDGRKIEMTGHGHKRVGPGQTSPLIVGIEYDGERGSHNIKGKGGVWTHTDLRFTLLDYDYGDWMEVEVQVMALEPVRPR